MSYTTSQVYGTASGGEMFIETTFMRYGQSHGGIIGITMRPDTLKTWALGLHIRSKLVKDNALMSEPDNAARQDTHKEEQKSRIEADAADRATICQTLDWSIDPLSTSNTADKIVNIVNGRVASVSVNVDKTVAIGNNKQKNSRVLGQIVSTIPFQRRR